MPRVIIRLSSRSRDTGDHSNTSKFAVAGMVAEQQQMQMMLKRVDRNIQTYSVLLAQPNLTFQQREIISGKLERTELAQKNAIEALSKLCTVSHIAELPPSYYKEH